MPARMVKITVVISIKSKRDRGFKASVQIVKNNLYGPLGRDVDNLTGLGRPSLV